MKRDALRSAEAGAATAPRWLASRERSNRFALALMAWIALRLGRGVARAVLHPITLYFLLFAPTARRHAARYLARALARPPGWRDHYRHIFCFASTVLDRIYFARGQLWRFDLQISGTDEVDAALASGRGAVFLGAHLGSFEALHALSELRPAARVAMAMYPENARMIHAVLQAVAPKFKFDVIPIGRSGSTLAIRDWLDGGGVVGMLADRLGPADTDRRPDIALPFLGQPARFADGPLRLAALLQRRVLFMAALYEGGNRYRLHFEPLADFSTAPAEPADPAARALRLQAAYPAYVARLESLCRASPYNWFNFYDFWHED